MIEQLEKLREFGSVIVPNAEDIEVGMAYVQTLLPQLVENILAMNPGATLIGADVIVGLKDATPGDGWPIGWYAMIEVK